MMSASLAREWRQFLLLSRTSVHRLLNAAVHSRDADPMQCTIWVAALATTPPTLFALRMIFIYAGADRASSIRVVEELALTHRLFFIVYGMVAAALLAALVWDALLPDRSDQEIVGVLPVRPRTIAAARLAGAATVAAAFTLAINAPSGLLFAVASSSAFGLGAFPMVFAAHVLATMLACLLVFFTLLSLRGLLALSPVAGAAQGLATLLQLFTIVALVEVFIYLPSVLPAIGERILQDDPAVAILPPAWFAGLYGSIAGTEREVVVPGAGVALAATLASAGLAAALYLGSAGILGRRTLETRARNGARGLTWLLRMMAPLWRGGRPYGRSSCSLCRAS